MNDTEVISCPACRHALRVPADMLGADVQCPECDASFTAPRRDGDRLTEAVLLSEPPERRIHRPAGRILWIPAFGLMLVGVVSIAINVYTLIEIAANPAAFEQRKQADTEALLTQVLGPNQAGANVPKIAWQSIAALSGWCVFCAIASFAAGVACLLRKGLWVARIGSILAFLNIAECCCAPGGIFGLWALILLFSEDARDYFS